jgi:hypothetical protein
MLLPSSSDSTPDIYNAHRIWVLILFSFCLIFPFVPAASRKSQAISRNTNFLPAVKPRWQFPRPIHHDCLTGQVWNSALTFGLWTCCHGKLTLPRCTSCPHPLFRDMIVPDHERRSNRRYRLWQSWTFSEVN